MLVTERVLIQVFFYASVHGLGQRGYQRRCQTVNVYEPSHHVRLCYCVRLRIHAYVLYGCNSFTLVMIVLI